ncbi:hypothetical protein PENTCL1PPCAC_24842, partial [Pristionchus entomophagus]
GSSPFDVSTCGKGKGCFLPNDCVPGATDNSCAFAFSFRPLDATSVEMELFVALDDDVKEDAFYVAVGFSDDDMMGDESTTECSRLLSETTASVKASYNYFSDEDKKTGVNNRRIDGEEANRPALFSSPKIKTVDGYAYCKYTQKIGGLGSMPMEYLTATTDTPFYFLLAKGTTTENGLKSHGRKGTAVSTMMKFSDTGSSASSISLVVVAMVTATASSFSLRSLIQPISYVLDASAVSEAAAAASPFDISTCGKGKGCFLPDACVPGAADNGCNLAYSYRPLDDVTVEMELYATMTLESELTEQSYWVAVAFSDDQNMGDETVTECSLLTSETKPSIKASYNFYDDEENKIAANNRRIDGEEKLRPQIFNTTTISAADGVIYCKFTQKIGGLGNVNKEFLVTDCKTPYYFLIAKGVTNNTDIAKHHHHQRAVSDQIKFGDTGSSSSVSIFIVALVTVGRMLF